MGDVLQDSGGAMTRPLANHSVSLNRVESSGDDTVETSPFLPQPNTARKQRQQQQQSFKAREWVGRLWRRISNGGQTDGQLPRTLAPPQPRNTANSHGECECGVPESEPLLKRLRRMNSRFDKSSHSQAPIVTPEMELRSIRERLHFHFTDFHSKYKNHKKKPWKFVLQILKIILISVQIGLFASAKSEVADFLEDNTKAMSRFFVSSDEELFTVSDVHKRIEKIVDGYYNIQHTSIGAYDYIWANGSTPPLDICVTYYKEGQIFAFNHSYHWNQDTYIECTPLGNGTNLNNANWIESTFTSTNFDRILRVRTVLRFMTLFLNGYGEPLCVALNVTVELNNANHAGRIPVTIVLTSNFLQCHGNIVKTLNTFDYGVGVALDSIIIVITCVAIVLTLRSLIKTAILARRIRTFLGKYSQHHLTWKEVVRLFDFWHINSIVADSLVMSGTALKLIVELKGDVATRNEVQHFTLCSFLLGVGCLLVWVGVLRFLSYFRGYNVLLLTVRVAFPNVMRFVLCSGILYLAFTFCGWIALGTYHSKFRTIIVTSETLYSLLNGDDMYRTFELMPTTPLAPYIFSQVYLYIFISVFIYFVLSQFIALITETYTEVLQMKEEDLEHFNACGHILQLLEVPLDDSRPPSTCEPSPPATGDPPANPFASGISEMAPIATSSLRSSMKQPARLSQSLPATSAVPPPAHGLQDSATPRNDGKSTSVRVEPRRRREQHQQESTQRQVFDLTKL